MEEIWKNVVGYEGLYQVSNNGKIKSLEKFNCINKKYSSIGYTRKEKLLKLWMNCQGYYMTDLYKNKKKKHELVHRLVAQAFISNSENKKFVNHIDGNKSNNNADNLEWVTPSENNLHAYRIGLQKPSNIKKVNQYDINGNYIKTWDKIKDVENELKISHSDIVTCCKKQKNRQTAGGYKWEYVEKGDFRQI